MNEKFRLEDILFVFGKWTIMIDSNLGSNLKPGSDYKLLDETGGELGLVTLGRVLSSRNPEIMPIEVEHFPEEIDMKQSKFIAPRMVSKVIREQNSDGSEGSEPEKR